MLPAPGIHFNVVFAIGRGSDIYFVADNSNEVNLENAAEIGEKIAERRGLGCEGKCRFTGTSAVNSAPTVYTFSIR